MSSLLPQQPQSPRYRERCRLDIRKAFELTLDALSVAGLLPKALSIAQ
jgi:hypothetical protein